MPLEAPQRRSGSVQRPQLHIQYRRKRLRYAQHVQNDRNGRISIPMEKRGAGPHVENDRNAQISIPMEKRGAGPLDCSSARACTEILFLGERSMCVSAASSMFRGSRTTRNHPSQ